MTEQTDKILVYGATWCPDCRRAKQFLGENRIPYEWIDITDNDEAIAYVEKVNNGNRSIPTIIFPDGEVMVEPSNTQLAEKTSTTIEADTNYYDVIIIGGGPAGLTAAIYASREGLNTLIIEAAGLGGQAAVTQVLDNFPGFQFGISGQEFADRLEEQARRFNANIIQGEEIVDIVRDGRNLVVTSINKREYIAGSVLLATGSKYRKLNIPGEDELIGINVHFCATCDGAFYKDKDIIVAGGGNSGFEEGIFLADKFATSVKIVEFMPDVKASQILQDKVAATANIEVITNHAVREFKHQDGKLVSVTVENRATEAIEEWTTDGIFVFIGLLPNTKWLPDTIELDKWGFIKTDQTLQTSLAGVFVAGDVREGSTKQAVSASGEGATAALMIRQYLQTIGDVNPVNSIERDDIITA